MDYFTRQVVEHTQSKDSAERGTSGSGASRGSTVDSELTITDSFGFVEKTIINGECGPA